MYEGKAIIKLLATMARDVRCMALKEGQSGNCEDIDKLESEAIEALRVEMNATYGQYEQPQSTVSPLYAPGINGAFQQYHKFSAMRTLRQNEVYDWARECFGEDGVTSKERARRVLEEAIELAQSEGVSPAQAKDILEHVYEKPVGVPHQEVGGVAISLLAYCTAAALNIEECEAAEFKRIMSHPREYFRRRHAIKVNKGIATGYDK